MTYGNYNKVVSQQGGWTDGSGNPTNERGNWHWRLSLTDSTIHAIRVDSRLVQLVVSAPLDDLGNHIPVDTPGDADWALDLNLSNQLYLSWDLNLMRLSKTLTSNVTQRVVVVYVGQALAANPTDPGNAAFATAIGDMPFKFPPVDYVTNGALGSTGWSLDADLTTSYATSWDNEPIVPATGANGLATRMAYSITLSEPGFPTLIPIVGVLTVDTTVVPGTTPGYVFSPLNPLGTVKLSCSGVAQFTPLGAWAATPGVAALRIVNRGFNDAWLETGSDLTLQVSKATSLYIPARSTRVVQPRLVNGALPTLASYICETPNWVYGSSEKVAGGVSIGSPASPQPGAITLQITSTVTNDAVWFNQMIRTGVAYTLGLWMYIPSAYNVLNDGSPRLDFDDNTLGTGGTKTVGRPDLTIRDAWQFVATTFTYGPSTLTTGNNVQGNVVIRHDAPNTGTEVYYISYLSLMETNPTADLLITQGGLV